MDCAGFFFEELGGGKNKVFKDFKDFKKNEKNKKKKQHT